MSGLRFRTHLFPSTVVIPLKCGSDKSWEQLVRGAPSPCRPLSQRSGEVAQRNGPLSLLDSEVVSPPALIADERWVILSRENAGVP